MNLLRNCIRTVGQPISNAGFALRHQPESPRNQWLQRYNTIARLAGLYTDMQKPPCYKTCFVKMLLAKEASVVFKNVRTPWLRRYVKAGCNQRPTFGRELTVTRFRIDVPLTPDVEEAEIADGTVVN